MTGARVTCSVTVSRKELQSALRTFTRVGRRVKQADAVVSMDDGNLVIALPGITASVPATGRWAGSVRIPGEVAVLLARTLPFQDPLHIRAGSKRLFIGNRSFPCDFSEGTGELSVPVNATMLDLLLVAQTHDSDAIDAAGLRVLVDAAFEERDRAIAFAARTLAPLGVTSEEVETLAHAAVERAGTRNSTTEPRETSPYP